MFNWVSDLRQIKQTLSSLNHLGVRIMTVISDFAASQKEFNVRIDDAIATLGDEVQALQDQIVKLQSSSSVSDEDKAALDNLTSHGQNLASQLEALKTLAASREVTPVVDPSAPVLNF